VRRLIGSDRGPQVAVALAVVASAGLYAGLARMLKGPHVFGDELYYSDAATSLAHGQGLHVRGESYGFGPFYPLLLALVRLTVANVPSAYWGWLTINAFAVALTAVPAYLLARRLLPPWWSVAVATLAVGVPSAFYAGAVMTDCLGYLTAVVALLAIVRSVESPTAGRQLAVLGAVALATSVRTQFAALYVTYLGALGLGRLLGGTSLGRLSPRQWWPTLAAVAAFALVLVATVASGRSVSSLLGAYGDLAHGYPVVATARWAVEHVFDLALYLGVLGGAATPVAVASLYRGARAGSSNDAAFLATFVSATVTGILVVATFSASQFGLGRLHDRYLFYVVPLWLVVLAAWVARGAPRSRPLVLTASFLFVVFVLVMPYGRLVVADGAKMFDGTGTAVFATLGDWLARSHGISGRWALAAGSLAAALWVVVVPRRLAWTLLPVVAASFIAGGAIMWKRTIDDSNKGVFSQQSVSTRAWVDRAVPKDAKVALVTVYAGACLNRLTRYSFLFTEFFNERIEQVPYVGAGLMVGPPTHQLHVERDGTLVTDRGTPLDVRYVVVPHGVGVRGRRLAVGTNASLVLWRTAAGIVQIPGARSDADVVARACT